jgi:hypothetical protein
MPPESGRCSAARPRGRERTFRVAGDTPEKLLEIAAALQRCQRITIDDADTPY